MSTATQLLTPSRRSSVVYPSSDGKPMAENTTQYEWIVRLKGGIEACCPDAFVAGDLLWYFVEGDPKQRVAPDVLVAFGRPRGPRMTYLQWEEGAVVPQVVVEVWSPGNRWPERARKLDLYSRLGVEEFITYDPDTNDFAAFLRTGRGALLEVEGTATSWVSPRLSIRFAPGEETLEVYGKDGARLPFFGELVEDARRSADARAKAEEERAKAEEERAKAEGRVEALTAKLRALGIDP